MYLVMVLKGTKIPVHVSNDGVGRDQNTSACVETDQNTSSCVERDQTTSARVK